MFILNGRFDPVAGNRIETALADEVRRLRNEGQDADKTAFDQRMADALENLVCAEAETASMSCDRRPSPTPIFRLGKPARGFPLQNRYPDRVPFANHSPMKGLPPGSLRSPTSCC